MTAQPLLDVSDLTDPVTDPAVAAGGLVEVRAGATAQVLGFANINDLAFGIFI